MSRVVCVYAYVFVDSNRIYVLASLCGKLFFFKASGQYVAEKDGGRKR